MMENKGILCDRNGNPSSATLRSNSGSNGENKEQFRATRVWNDIVYSFYNGIELRKHRHHMKSYYDCFTTSDAVTWLKRFLRECDHFPNTGSKVTRFQALNLLRKFHSTNIIERVIQKNSNHNKGSSKNKNENNNNNNNENNHKDSDKELQDNGELFRFTKEANENVPFLATSTMPGMDGSFVKLPENDVDLEQVELSPAEKQEAHRKCVWEMMLKIEPKIISQLKYEQICPAAVYDCFHKVNTNGVVQLRDKSADLPHWLMSAMKCLAAWPKASGSGNCLPKYPGFEADVFALVREFFHNAPEPVIPSEYYQLLVDTFDKFQLDSGASLSSAIPTTSAVSLSQFKAQAPALQPKKEMSTFTPVTGPPKPPQRFSTLPHKSSTKRWGITGNIYLPVPASSSASSSTHFSTFSRSKITPEFGGNGQNSRLPISSGFVPAPSCVYETEFNDIEPITKIVPIEPSNSVSQSIDNYFGTQFSQQNPTQQTNPLHKSSVQNYYSTFQSQNSAQPNIPAEKSRLTDSSTLNRAHFRKNPAAQSTSQNSSFSALSTIPRKSTKSRLAALAAVTSPSQGSNCGNSTFESSTFEISLNVSTTTVTSPAGGVGEKPARNESRKSNRFYKLIQLILMILPSSSRRHIHLLARLFYKIIRNKELCILKKDSIALKQHIVTLFTRSLLRCEREVEYSESKARLFIDFLIDECMDIFEIPEDLKDDIDSSLTKLKKQKGASEQNFCAKVTQAEFELQRDVLSELALTDLLRSIMLDDNMSERDKLKWIKQFKLYHPEVSDVYFGSATANSATSHQHHNHQNHPLTSALLGPENKKNKALEKKRNSSLSPKKNKNNHNDNGDNRNLSLFHSLPRPIKKILSR